MSLAIVASAVATLAGCASTDGPAKPSRTPARTSAPPNAVMLDYMSPEELEHSRQLEREAAAPPPGTIGEKDPPPRIRQTIVIGRNNPDPVWEMDHPQATYDEPQPQAPSAPPPTYRSGPTYYYRSGGVGGGQGMGTSGTPRVGGDWPAAPSYGPKQMR